MKNEEQLKDEIREAKREARAERWGVKIVDKVKFVQHWEEYIQTIFFAILFAGALILVMAAMAYQDYQNQYNPDAFSVSGLMDDCESGELEVQKLVTDNGRFEFSCKDKIVKVKGDYTQ